MKKEPDTYVIATIPKGGTIADAAPVKTGNDAIDLITGSITKNLAARKTLDALHLDACATGLAVTTVNVNFNVERIDLSDYNADEHKPGGVEMYIERRMSGYYYTFTPTGVDAIDKILSAIACAGKACHHTGDWRTGVASAYDDHTGSTPVEWIQNAADEAAFKLRYKP